MDFWFDVNCKLCKSYINLYKSQEKNPTMPCCQRIPQRRHVELVANTETGSMDLKKARVCMPYRGLCACHEVCPVRDCSAPVVPRQEEFSGAATGPVTYQYTVVGDTIFLLTVVKIYN